MDPSNATTFRRMASGLCLLVGPAMILLAAILEPAGSGGDETSAYLQSLKDDPDRAQLSIALWMLGFALMAVGIVGLVHVIRRRGVVLANVGGAFAILGMVFFVALIASSIHDLNNAEHLDLAIADRLADDIEDYWVFGMVLGIALVGTAVGFILLGLAVIRSGVAHMAAGILIIVGILLVGPGEDSDVLDVVANALLLAGWGLVGLKLLGMKDEEWDAPAPPGAPPANV